MVNKPGGIRISSRLDDIISQMMKGGFEKAGTVNDDGGKDKENGHDQITNIVNTQPANVLTYP